MPRGNIAQAAGAQPEAAFQPGAFPGSSSPSKICAPADTGFWLGDFGKDGRLRAARRSVAACFHSSDRGATKGFVPARNGCRLRQLKAHERTPAPVPPLQSRHLLLIAFKPDEPARLRSIG